MNYSCFFCMAEEPLSEVEVFYNTCITWEDYPRLIRVEYNKKLVGLFTVGDYVTFEGRNGTGVLITDIIGSEEEGPKGITYLPFRDCENRWATPVYSLRGDPRFLICPPGGSLHYGLHIPWETFAKIPPPDTPVFHDKVAKVQQRFQEKVDETMAEKENEEEIVGLEV